MFAGLAMFVMTALFHGPELGSEDQGLARRTTFRLRFNGIVFKLTWIPRFRKPVHRRLCLRSDKHPLCGNRRILLFFHRRKGNRFDLILLFIIVSLVAPY